MLFFDMGVQTINTTSTNIVIAVQNNLSLQKKVDNNILVISVHNQTFNQNDYQNGFYNTMNCFNLSILLVFAAQHEIRRYV